MSEWIEKLPLVDPGPGIPPELVAAFVRHLPDFYTVVDRQGLIVTFSRLLPNTVAEDYLGKNIADFSLPEERWKLEGAMQEARRSGQAVQFEGVARSTEGAGLRSYILRVVPLNQPGWEDKLLVVSTDVTFQRQLWQEHQRHSERLAQFQDHASLLAISMDRDMRITEWNAAAEQLFGYRREEILGRPADEFLYFADQAQAMRAAFAGAMADRSSIRDQRVIHRTKAGERVVCDWFALPLIDERGDTVGLASLGQDVTLAIRAEDALKEAKRLAEVSAREKSRFLAKMSHELRTPLHGILGALDLLQARRLGSDVGSELGIIRASSQTLLTVVNDVLDFAKIESGGVVLARSPLSLPRLLSEVHELLRPLIEAKQLGFNLELTPQLPEFIMGDADRLRQILVNLVSNAIKFTEHGRINVRASVEPRGDGFQVLLEVQDTGIGISAADQKSIFKEFFQVEGANTRRYGGTGLGLAISRSLAELMGGRLEVHSTRGLGSTFSLSFPSCRAEATREHRIHHEFRDYRRRVLLVDDNSINVAVGRKMLEKMGIDVVVAVNGAEAVAHAVAEPFDLILMDLHMPVMDGIEATRTIRDSHGARGRVPILGVTANVLPEDRERCLQAGMNEVLLKPFRYGQLLEALDAQFNSAMDGSS